MVRRSMLTTIQLTEIRERMEGEALIAELGLDERIISSIKNKTGWAAIKILSHDIHALLTEITRLTNEVERLQTLYDVAAVDLACVV